MTQGYGPNTVAHLMKGFQASGDLSAKQYHFVADTGTVNEVAAVASALDLIIGVLQEPGADNEVVSVALPGQVCLVIFGGTVSQHQPITCNDDGEAVLAGPGDVIRGYAACDAADTEIGPVYLVPPTARMVGQKARTVAVDRTTTSRMTVDEYAGATIYASKGSAQAIELATPTAAQAGIKFRTVRTTHASALTLSTQGTETIGGGATFATQDAVGDTAEFEWTGTAWMLINSIIA